MAKKLTALLLTLLMVLSCAAFTASAKDLEYYVETDGTGDGSDDDPFGTLEEAFEALDGKGGTIYIFGTYNLSAFKAPAEWTEMVTIKGVNADSVLHIDPSASALFEGPITLKDIRYDIGTNAHINPVGTECILDGGNDSAFTGMVHFPAFSNRVLEGDTYLELASGRVGTIFLGGGYNTSYANGVMGDSTFVMSGGEAKLDLACDAYTDVMTGISIGGNMNVIINGGVATAMVLKRESTVPEILGALNIIFNNGIEAPSTFTYPETAIMGTFIIHSAEGGMVMPTKEPGVFEIKADAGKVAVIDGKQVFDGNVTLEAGEIDVTWVPGEQPEKTEDEPIEIKLVIGSAELVKNGEKTALDVPAQIIDDRTMVPLRAIFEALGASVEWDDATKTVTSVKDDTTVKLTIGENKLTVNGEEKTLDVPGQIVESRTLVPARAVAESFGCTVEWDAPTQTVTITK